MKKYLLLYFFLGFILNSKGQETVKISPEYPMRGDSIIIIYQPNASASTEGSIPRLEFTYSNF